MLQAKLLGVAAVDSIHKKNLEILNDRGKKYRPGQFSVLTSWNMAGVLDQERNLYKDIMQISSQSKEVRFYVNVLHILKISEIFFLKFKVRCGNSFKELDALISLFVYLPKILAKFKLVFQIM